MKTKIGTITIALRKEDSKIRSPKRKDDSTVLTFMFAEVWTLIFRRCDRSLPGCQRWNATAKKLFRLAILPSGITVVAAIAVMAGNRLDSNQKVIIYAVATGVSMIPASLIVILTTTVAFGTKRMVKRDVIVRKMEDGSQEVLDSVKRHLLRW